VYQFGWLRDGSWCAYALDVAGHHEQAGAWHRWVARTLHFSEDLGLGSTRQSLLSQLRTAV